MTEQRNVDLRASETRYRTLIDQVKDYAIFATDPQGRATTWNEGVLRILGFDEQDFIGQDIVETIFTPEDVETGVAQQELDTAANRGSASNDRWMRRKSGERFYANGVTTALRDDCGTLIGFTKVMRDSTERQRTESLVECQKQLLEKLLQGEALEQVLDFFARSMESQSQAGVVVAIHTLEADGYHFGYVAAPSLPASYGEATTGMDARLELSTSSAAVMSHTPTVVRDFATEPRWPAFTADILSLGIRGGFTAPILSPDLRVLGTFAVYYREPRDPSPYDQQMVDLVTRTVAVAIERRQIEASLAASELRFRTLADNIPQLAWIADADTQGQVHWFNQNWFEYTGTTLEQMKGQGWHAVHHPDHADRVIKKFAHHVQKGLDWEDTFPLRGKDGRFRWFLSRMKVIRDASGKVVQIFGTNTDITDERRMADELRQNAADMAEMDRRKDEFLAMLAHELRGPLAPIRNALQIVRHGAIQDGDSSEHDAIRSATEMMDRQTAHLVRLVDDLLDVSRASRGKTQLRRTPVELASIVSHAVEAGQPLFDAGGLTLTVTVPPDPIYLHGDSSRLIQVIGNLLSNAAKFTPVGGRVWLTVEQRDGSAVIRVRDSGIGIAPDDQSRVFELFMQVDTSLERTRSGLGIGLTLAKQLVELHDGTIDVQSGGIGQGTEFVVRVPMLMEPPAAPASPHPPAHQTMIARSRRILVVDDNRDSAESLVMLLEFLGHEVRMAHDGLEAADAAALFTPDVILLDIGLPKLNGYEVARRIRSGPSGERVLLIALTGWGQDSDRIRSAEAGFDHHLVKPVNHNALAKLIADWPLSNDAPRR